MSVTFQLGRPTKFPHKTSLCRGCNGSDDPSARFSDGPNKSNYDCGDCLGFGGDTSVQNAIEDARATLEGEFNVANANADFILRAVLNLADEEADDCAGSLNPSIILQRIATFTDPSRGEVLPTSTQAVRLSAEGVGLGVTFINAGRTVAQVESYLMRLKRLAEIALAEGVEVTWG